MRAIGNSRDYVALESSMHAMKGYRRKALPISPPALALGILMHVISDTVHCDKQFD